MMMKNTLVALALAAPLAACITHESANVYSKHEAGREQTVRMAGTAQWTLVATSRQKIRNVTLKKRLHARQDIPVMHSTPQIYDGVG